MVGTNFMINFINEKDDNVFGTNIDNRIHDDDDMYDSDNDIIPNMFEDKQDDAVCEPFNKSNTIAIFRNLRFTLSEYFFIYPCSKRMELFWLIGKELQNPETPCRCTNVQFYDAMAHHCRSMDNIHHTIVHQFFYHQLIVTNQK